MVDYADSSQLNLWQFDSPETLARCRSLANKKARNLLFQRSQQKQQLLEQVQDRTTNEGVSDAAAATTSDGDAAAAVTSAGTAAPVPPPSSSTTSRNPTSTTSASSNSFPVEHFACGFSSAASQRHQQHGNHDDDDANDAPPTSPKGHAYVTPEEEQLLVSFYVSKLPGLIGPMAPAVRCRRESKVSATAALLTRRFFLSNSVMLFDPKAVMVAAAFLAAKVEDATIDVRHLEEGTALMNAPVTKDEIIPAEICLLEGTHFDLLCFHPIKCVLAVTEDLRTYLKSDQGQGLVVRAGAVSNATTVVSGQDLKPIYDAARALLDDALVSDLPLLFNPGHVGLAALMVGQEHVMESAAAEAEAATETAAASSSSHDGMPPPPPPSSTTLPSPPRIDFEGYVRQRFIEGGSVDEMLETLQTICQMLRELKDGKWGCGNYFTDVVALKSIHKKLKKVRVWGVKESSSSKESSKKRDLASPDASASERPSKKSKTKAE